MRSNVLIVGDIRGCGRQAFGGVRCPLYSVCSVSRSCIAIAVGSTAQANDD